MWVSPFRYLRIIVYLPLPAAFRSLSRLSSALSAKASTLRSYQLNQLDEKAVGRVILSSVQACLLRNLESCGRPFAKQKAMTDAVGHITALSLPSFPLLHV